MVFVPATNTVEAAIHYEVDDQECVNTLYFKKSSPWNSTSMADLAESLNGWVLDSCLPLQGANTVYRSIHLRELSSASSLVADREAPAGSFGGQAAVQTANNVTCAISFRTGLAGRSFRGRNYIVGIPGIYVLDSKVDAAYLGQWDDAYALLPALASDSSSEWSVVSRFSGKDEDDKPLPRAFAVVTPITSAYFVDNVVDSMRTRLPKRGR